MSINSTKDDEELKETLKSDVMKRLLSLLLSYKKEITIVTLLILVGVAVGTAYPLILKHVINVEIPAGQGTGRINGLILWIGIALGLALINLIASRIWRKIMARVSNKIVGDVRRNLYIHLQSLGLDFYDSRPAGKILARVTGDVNSLKDVLSSTVTQLIPEAVTIVTVVIVMIIVDPMLTLAAIASIPIIACGVFFCEILAHKKWQIMRKKESNMTAFIHENIAGIGIIQSFNAESEEHSEFVRIVDEHKLSFRNAVRIADIFSPTIEISYGLGTFLLYFIGIRILGINAASIGTFTAFGIYMGMFWGPIRNLANYYNKLITNISAAERIFEIMDTKPTVSDELIAEASDSSSAATITAELPPIKGRVDFERVSFAYPDEPEKNVLNDVSFTVTPGQTIALVGPTGAGKTTIVSLISRFYNCTGGVVKIDGNDVKKVTLNSLRSQLGIMTQDNYLFSGTIRDNIRYGKLNATDEEIEAAAKAVHAHEFITKLENGYDTEISERGGGLSIGQRQLIAFARTLVADPAILILDEATSSIDTQTEILVQQGIETLLAGRTSFVVAHRLSTIKNADRIMVIDNGGIFEEGNHEQLMQKQGAYYKLYTAQII